MSFRDTWIKLLILAVPAKYRATLYKVMSHSLDMKTFLLKMVNNRKAGDLRRHRAHYDVSENPWALMDHILVLHMECGLSALLIAARSCPTYLSGEVRP